jgi:hypothetical protein
MATCFGRKFNHYQALKKSVQVPGILWDPIVFINYIDPIKDTRLVPVQVPSTLWNPI